MRPEPPPSLGADLRALRRARGLTLQAMAEGLGRSVGWVSQVERDLSQPAIADLRAIADLLGVPLSLLFGTPRAPVIEEGHVVRAGARRSLGDRAAGLVEELLSPDLTDDFEVVHSTFAPGARFDHPQGRPTQELAYMLAGHLDLTIGDHAFSVGPGDSFRIRNQPFGWHNPHPTPAVAIWVIAPPVY